MLEDGAEAALYLRRRSKGWVPDRVAKGAHVAVLVVEGREVSRCQELRFSELVQVLNQGEHIQVTL